MAYMNKNKRSVFFNIVFTSLAVSILVFVMAYYTSVSKSEENLKDYLISSRIYQKNFMLESSFNKTFNNYNNFAFRFEPQYIRFYDYFSDSSKMSLFKSDLGYFKSFIKPKINAEIEYYFTYAYHYMYLESGGNLGRISHYYDGMRTEFSWLFSDFSSISYAIYMNQCDNAGIYPTVTQGSFPVSINVDYKTSSSVRSSNIDTTKTNSFRIECAKGIPPAPVTYYNFLITLTPGSTDKITYTLQDSGLSPFQVMSTYNFKTTVPFIDVYNNFYTQLIEKQTTYDLPNARIYVT